MKILKHRWDPVLPYINGDVLDIGCVGMGSNDVYGGEDFIHDKIKKRANFLLGLDINSEGVEMMKSKGFNMICQDAQEHFNLNRKFDIVLSEENIEHISNLKTYLENVRNHLEEEGLFLITTPNILCIDFIIHRFLFKKPRANPTHTHYHIEDTIKCLLESNGFEVVKIEKFQAINWKIQNIGGKIMWFFARIFPERFGRNMIIVAKKKNLD